MRRASASSVSPPPTDNVYTTQDGRRLRIDPFWQCAATNFELDWARLTSKIIRDDLQRAHTPYNHSGSAFAAYAPVFLDHIAAYALEEQLRWKGYILHPFDTGADVTQHDTSLLALLHPDPDFGPPQTAEDQIDLTTFQLEQLFQAGMTALRQDAAEQVRGIVKEDAPFLIHADMPAIRMFMEIASDVEDAGLVAMSQMVGNTPLCPETAHQEALDGLEATVTDVYKHFSAHLNALCPNLPAVAHPLYQGYLCVGLKSVADAFNKMSNPRRDDHAYLAGTILSGQGIIQTTSRADIKAPRGEGPVASYTSELSVMMATLAQRVATGGADTDAQAFTSKRAGHPVGARSQSTDTLQQARNAAHTVFQEAAQLVNKSVDHLSGYQQRASVSPHAKQRQRQLQ